MSVTGGESFFGDVLQDQDWVYPPRIPDLSVLPLTSPWLNFQDLRTLFWLFWPRGSPREELDILVAGCGSMQAAAQAYVYPQARVVGIDISRACLEHNETLQRKHGLTNLTLRQLRVEEAASLDRRFDFIVCYNVLDYLDDPAAGLRGLGQALLPDGVIDLRIYSKHARYGVTMLQDLFRAMGLEANTADIQTARELLASMPQNHPVHRFFHQAEQELATNEGLVNHFLCRREQPLTSGECLDLVQEAGLVFQGWKESALYYPDSRIPAGHSLWPHLSGLTERQLWQFIETLDPTVPMHGFYACRADRDPALYRIQFDDDAFLGYIPLARVSQTVEANRLRRQPAVIARPPFPPMPLDERQAATFKQIDGVRSIRECLAQAGLSPEDPANRDWARYFFRSLWRAGYAMFRLPG